MAIIRAKQVPDRTHIYLVRTSAVKPEMRIVVARDAVLVAHMPYMHIHAIGNANTRNSRHIAAEPVEIRLCFVALNARRAVDE